MNYQYLIPGSQGDPASFDANSTLTLGSYSKPLDARTQIAVDYSQLVPPVMILNYSFRVSPGGEPQLVISGSDIGDGADLITFFVGGGIAGRSYEVRINTRLDSGETRSDVLTIDVQGDDCGCMRVVAPVVPNGATSADGSVVVNTAPRFFVSDTIPVGARVLDRWYDTTTGAIYDYISNGLTTLWQAAGGGGGGGGGGSNVTILNITPIHPDGVTTLFNLTSTTGRPVTITGTNTLFVSIDGVWQDAATQYTAVDDQVAFVQPPFRDSVVFMLWFAPFTTTI